MPVIVRGDSKAHAIRGSMYIFRDVVIVYKKHIAISTYVLIISYGYPQIYLVYPLPARPLKTIIGKRPLPVSGTGGDL